MPSTDLDGNRRDGLDEWSRFLRAEGHVLARHPSLVFQQAANQPESSSLAREARVDQPRAARQWVRWINKERSAEPCLLTLAAESSVHALAWSPDGTRIVGGTWNHALKVWNVETGQAIATLLGHNGYITRCAYSPDGRWLISGSDDKSIKVWNAETYEFLASLEGHTDRVITFACSPERWIVSAGYWDQSLRLWDAAGRAVATLSGHTANITCCAFSPDGRRIVSSSLDGTLRIWDRESHRTIATLTGHTDPVDACAYSPDGRRVASASRDKTVRIWDGESGRPVATLEGHTGRVRSCRYSPDGRRLVSSNTEAVKVWDASTHALVATGAGVPVVGPFECTFSPDGGRIASVFQQSALRICDAESGEPAAMLEGHAGQINVFAFSPDGSRVATGSNDDTVKIWDANAGGLGSSDAAVAATRHGIRVCRYSPNRQQIATALSDFTLKLWRSQDGRADRTLTSHVSIITSCAYSPDGARLVSSSYDASSQVWDAATGRRIGLLMDDTGFVMSCAWSPDGERIVTGSTGPPGRTLTIWDSDTFQRVTRLNNELGGGVFACAYSADGRRIVSSSSNALVLWDAESGAALVELPTHSGFALSPDDTRLITFARGDSAACIWDGQRVVASLAGPSHATTAQAYSPDARQILTGDKSGDLRTWNAETGELLTTLTGHSGRINACAYSSDGRCIVSISADGTLRIWDRAAAEQRFVFPLGTTDSCLSVAPPLRVAAGDSTQLYVLQPEGIECEPPLVTAVFLYRARLQRFDATPTAVCEWCGCRFPSTAAVRDALDSIGRNRIASQPLPPEAWMEPRLRSACAGCSKPVTFNPFVVDNRRQFQQGWLHRLGLK